MGQCQICGKSSITQKTFECEVCGKRACNKCALELLSMLEHSKVKHLYVCSEQCFEAFVNKVEGQEFEEQAAFRDLVELYMGNVCYPPIEPRGLALWNKHDDKAFERMDESACAEDLKEAKNMEKAGRFEEAALIYERLEMFEEAGRVRAKARSIPILKTEVSVDLNKLLEQVKDGGIVVVYRCPHCGGKLKVGKDTRVESLKHCEHCDSEIEAMDLADFLKTALS